VHRCDIKGELFIWYRIKRTSIVAIILGPFFCFGLDDLLSGNLCLIKSAGGGKGAAGRK